MLGFGNKKQNQNFNQQLPYNMAQHTMNANGGYPEEQMMQIPPNTQSMLPQQASQTPQENGSRLEEYISRRNAEIDAQVQEFTRKNPMFDMRREIQNPQFCNYVWGNGLSIEDAYCLVHRNDSANGSNMNFNQNRMIEKRIPENGTGRSGGSGMIKKNPKDLSDEEIDEIVQRVRNGEKISF